MIKYKVTEEIQQSTTKGRFMDPGIHENSELTRAEYNKSEKSEYIAFYFENERKEQMCHTEWKIRMNKPVSEMEEGLIKWYTDKINEQVCRINKIVTTFIPTEEFRNTEADDFESFCKKTLEVLGGKYKNQKVRIKVIYDRRNYTALPSYTNYEWIEPMSIPSEESQIEILGRDKIVKDFPKRIEGADPVKNEIEEKASENGNGSGLPF